MFLTKFSSAKFNAFKHEIYSFLVGFASIKPIYKDYMFVEFFYLFLEFAHMQSLVQSA
jgi:hypothetical protein